MSLLLAVNMATVVLESLLYGLFLVSASTTLYLRFSRHNAPKNCSWPVWTRNPVVVFTVAIFAACSAHWILTVIRFFDAFLGPVDAHRFYLNESKGTQIAKRVLTVISVLIGDAAIIHRLWLIWDQSFLVIVIPGLSWLGILAGGCAITYLYSWPSATHMVAAANWVKANWVLTLGTNVYCTGLVIWNIRNRNRAVKELGEGILVPVLMILLESATAWTIWALFFAVTSDIGSPLQFIATDLSPTIVGLANMAIYLRVELECTRPDPTGLPMTTSASIFALTTPRPSTSNSK
ncbi:hypothetical protein C8F04DRAFT_1156952 [Mycena alexandri]|uniref:Uncharacterized protein n=1 Tax=Mycena alexandri TaxID=1745969 RepID=A0AAD6RXQ5_9AGAR|nr:hypothetical protein C8F04DRAFT_1156952 [Mycena alexandri]